MIKIRKTRYQTS